MWNPVPNEVEVKHDIPFVPPAGRFDARSLEWSVQVRASGRINGIWRFSHEHFGDAEITLLCLI